jgi:uncharacterized protein YvpB
MSNVCFGFKPSTIDGSETIFKGSDKIELPDSYTYKPYLPSVVDQGNMEICVPCTMSAYLNWRENLKEGVTKDNKISMNEIYSSRTNSGEGMTYKDAFKFLRHNGVNSKNGKLKISLYGLIQNNLTLKYAIVMNGPCFGALPVYNSDKDFWNKKGDDKLMGYHAISIVGYDEDGFFIRNSWGIGFGDKGYTHIKNEDMNKMIEMWTIIE